MESGNEGVDCFFNLQSYTGIMTDDLAQEVRSLALGVRAMAAGFTIMLSFFNIWAAFLIQFFQRLFEDALPGKPLPFFVSFLIEYRIPLIIFSILMPIAGVVILALMRNHKMALILNTVIIVVIFGQMTLTVCSLLAPMFDLCQLAGG